MLEPMLKIMELAITMVFERFPSEHNNPMIPHICMAVADELAEKHSDLFIIPFIEQFVSWTDIRFDENFGTSVGHQERDIKVKDVLDFNRPYTDKMWDKYSYLKEEIDYDKCERSKKNK